MPRPCRDLHVLPDPVCPVCSLYLSRDDYRELWDRQPPPFFMPPPRPKPKLPQYPSLGKLAAVFDEKTLEPHRPGKRFNPSLVKHPKKDGYLFCYRDGWGGSNLWMVELSTEFKVLGPAWRLELYHPYAQYGREDPRLFWHQGRLHVSYTGVMSDPRGLWTNVLYARLTEDFRVEKIYSPHYAQRTFWEKNWMFFSHSDELYAVYSYNPCRILKIDGDKAELAYESKCHVPWEGGLLRGGASPVLVGDELYCWFHDAVQVQGFRIYRNGFLTLEAKPPFGLVRLTPEPLLSADVSNKPSDQYCFVRWVAGAVLEEGVWTLSTGEHDRWSHIYRLEDSLVQERAVRLRPPRYWRCRPETDDSRIYQAIHADDEYRLRGRSFTPSDAAIDVGAHSGIFSHLVLERGIGRVWAVEAGSDSFTELSHNLVPYAGKVKPILAAVWRSDEPSSVRFWSGGKGPASNEWPSGGTILYNEGTEKIETVAFDKLVLEAVAWSSSGRVRLVKLDCEGAEGPILATSKTLHLIDELIGEYHFIPPLFSKPCPDLPEFSPAWLVETLEKAGFRVELKPGDNHLGLFWAKR